MYEWTQKRSLFGMKWSIVLEKKNWTVWVKDRRVEECEVVTTGWN